MLLYTRESSSMFLEYVLLSLHFCLAAKDMNTQSFQSYFSHRRCHYASSLSSGFHNQTLINLTPWETIGLRKRERWINIPNVSFSRTVGTYWKILKSCLVKAFYKRRRGIKAARVTRVMDAWRSIRKVTMIRWGAIKQMSGSGQLFVFLDLQVFFFAKPKFFPLVIFYYSVLFIVRWILLLLHFISALLLAILSRLLLATVLLLAPLHLYILLTTINTTFQFIK